MRQTEFLTAPFVRSVLLPTDFREGDTHALAHALAIALFRDTKLTLLDAGDDDRGGPWTAQPAVRATLGRWGLCAGDDPLDALVRRTSALSFRRERNDAALRRVERADSELVILPTAGGVLPGWLDPALGTRLQAEKDALTLFVPDRGRGLVDPEDGRITLRRVLVPVDRRPIPELATQVAARVAQMTGTDPVDLHLLHVSPRRRPGFDVAVPYEHSCTWRPAHEVGSPATTIVASAEELEVDLIVMATAGVHGALDALRGRVSSHVLRHAPCPLLTVPALWRPS